MLNHHLTVEERLDVMEALLNATIWGPFLDNPEHRQEIASTLNDLIAVCERHESISTNALTELKNISDALAEIDRMPDSIRPLLRP
jgi:hypothetical protein